MPTFNDPNTATPRSRRNPRIARTPDSNTTATVSNSNSSNSNTNPTVTTTPNANGQPIGPTDPNQLNSKPFKDLANRANELLAKQTLDLQAPLQYSATAKIDKDGKIVKGSYRTIKAVSSNADLAGLVKDSVAAFDESNLLKFLAPISGERVDFMIQQDQTAITAGIQSVLERETKASAAKSALDLGLSFAKTKKEKEIQDLQAKIADPKTAPETIADLQKELLNTQDDLLLINSTSVVVDGKKLNVGFSVPKDVLHQMLKRKLDEQAAEMKKVNSTASGNSNQSTAVK